MRILHRRAMGRSGAVVVAATERADGDFHPRRTDPRMLERRQLAATGRTWVMTDQVHGVGVHAVERDAPPVASIAAARIQRADVIVASGAELPLAVWAADCAALVLVGDGGTVVAAHAGWRGLAAGVVDVAVGAATDRRDRPRTAVLGPVIRPCCYAFGAGELEQVAHAVGAPPDRIAGATATGMPALDVPAAVASALRRHGLRLDAVGPCTACDRRWFSHRRGDTARHAVVVWQDGGAGDRCGGPDGS